MGAPYANPAPLQSAMAELAAGLSGSRLNPLVLMSDPERTPDLLDLARNLPSGSAVIYRHFGSPGLEIQLRHITAQRQVQLLIGNDPELAEACQADGVHFSRGTEGKILSQWRTSRPDWIISSAAAKTGTDPRPLDGLDALFVSPVFASDSPSAGTPIGVEALKNLTTTLPCPVFALGGVNDHTAPLLHATGIAGIAAIGGLAEHLRADSHLRTRSQTRTQTMSPNPTDKTVTISKHEDSAMIIFTAEVTGASQTGELTLRRVADGIWNANHTGVPKAIGGRGVGKALVAAMVEDARHQGYRIVPGCPFVAKLFERKPDWAEDVAA